MSGSRPGTATSEDSGYPRTRLARWPGWPGLRTVGAGPCACRIAVPRDEGFARDAGTVEEKPALNFAGLLRQLRAEARLTQEELAEAASLSPRSVSDLGRGINRTARKDTAVLLAGALGLPEPVGGLFVAAARGRAPAAEVLAARERVALGAFAAAATRTLPRDIASFTGRQGEMAQLMRALAASATGGVVGIHVIDGMAGIGKTSLAVHAAHRLAPSFPDGQFFLPLHAHTPGQRPVYPGDALASLLLTAGLAPQQIPPGVEARRYAPESLNEYSGTCMDMRTDNALISAMSACCCPLPTNLSYCHRF